MAKTNFTKAEEAFDDGLRKASVNKLFEIVDENATLSDPEKALELAAKQGKIPIAADRQLLSVLKHELHHLHKKGLDIYTQLNLDKKQFKQWCENPNSLTAAEWTRIKELKEKVDSLKKESQTPDDELIQSERNKHINKRFNVKDKWLPLK